MGETCAAQAVIAIENRQQFREVQARFERERASRKLSEVISESTDDEQPEFDMILESAARLCNAPMAGLVLINEARTHYELVAERGASPEFVAQLRAEPPEMDPERYAAAKAMLKKTHRSC